MGQEIKQVPFLSNIGTPEIIVIAIVILVLFGGKKMNEWAKGIGEAGKELKKAKREFESSFNDEVPTEEKPRATQKRARKGVG